MKRYINSRDFFLTELNPELRVAELNYPQSKFNEFLKTLKISEEGEVTPDDKTSIKAIKDQIHAIKRKHPDEDPAKFDFDIAVIFHENLKINRHMLNDWGFWRWLSLNYFIEEIQWRWAKKAREKSEVQRAASAIFDHLTGKSKNHRIFPRRHYALGLRLYDGSYDLINRISANLKNGVQGGYGDFINNLVDTKLLSSNDNAAKTMGNLLLGSDKVMAKDSVVSSFKRFNGFKNRLLSDASEDIFRKEICQVKLLD